jgi:anti-sigma B factor antagonist
MSDSCLIVGEQAGVSVVTFQDNAILDTLAIQSASRQLFELVDSPRTPNVLLDFRNVRFLSSQALGVLLTLRRKAAKTNTQVVFSGLRPELLRVFQLTKLDTMFSFFETPEEALAHFAKPPGG